MLKKEKFKKFLNNKAMARELRMLLLLAISAEANGNKLTGIIENTLNRYFKVLKDNDILRVRPSIEEMGIMKEMIEASL